MSELQLQPTPFSNGPTCEGVSFVASEAPLDIAAITISGRYPERGWAQNEVVHEMVYIADGLGSLALRSGEIVRLASGSAVHVPAGEWFAWEGEMKLVMACQPAFSPDQYRIEEEM